MIDHDLWHNVGNAIEGSIFSIIMRRIASIRCDEKGTLFLKK
jgi:hypothetical protein